MTAEEVHTDLGRQDVFEPSENEWETVSMGNEDEWNEPISGETDSEPIDGYYKTLESSGARQRAVSLSRRIPKRS